MEVLGEQGERVVGCEKVAEEGLREEDVDKVLDECLDKRGYAMRCQVKITTCHNLQLRMANYTARDVYVRLLGHVDHISGTGTEASEIMI